MRVEEGGLVLPGRQEIIELHTATIERHGGLKVPPDPKKVESAITEVVVFHVYRPQADLALLAARLAYAFAKGHPLPDGNKRMAFIAVRMLLRLNGYTWKPRYDQAEDRMWRLAESLPVDQEQVLESMAAWIREDCWPICS